MQGPTSLIPSNTKIFIACSSGGLERLGMRLGGLLETDLGCHMQKATMGGVLEILVNELQVIPLFKVPLLVVTTTTNQVM